LNQVLNQDVRLRQQVRQRLVGKSVAIRASTSKITDGAAASGMAIP
jgi:hypothetical protein